MRRTIMIVGMLFLTGGLMPPLAFSAYHHAGEADAPNFLAVYPDKAGTKLDNCALCHCGGMQGKKKLGSCQWCHYKYGYDQSGDILATLNTYGRAYLDSGRTTAALQAIQDLDSDSDGYSNLAEIQACRYPGDPADDPSKVPAPFRVYTKAQLAAMPQHTQFLLMNTSKSGDFYAAYGGVSMKALLDDAGITSDASNIQVFAPDGWAQFHPLEYDPAPNMYHVYGTMPGQSYQYPPATYFYDVQADIATNPATGWCDYSAPSCSGRNHGDPITVTDGLMAILALSRDGADLTPGVLNPQNKLDGEGPFRVVVPQTVVGPPDQASTSPAQDVLWPYNASWDHNAGACSRTATIIKVEPLPAGTTDIDVLEAGWAYVDQAKIVVYGAINGADSNGNGVLDSEEGINDADFDRDGIPDYRDIDTAKPRQAKGITQLILHTSYGALAAVACLDDKDPLVSQIGKPTDPIPYGTTQFKIAVLKPGQSAMLTVVFPDDIPLNTRVYQISLSGWKEIPLWAIIRAWINGILNMAGVGSSSTERSVGNPRATTANLANAKGCGVRLIPVMLTDGDPISDADGEKDGVITEHFALATPEKGVCFVSVAESTPSIYTCLILGLVLFGLAFSARRIRKD